MDAPEFRLLGPFEVIRGGQVLAAGGGRRRALLALLVLAANREVTAGRLIEAVWGEDPPRSAVNLVQGYVSTWRTVLEPHRSPRSSGGRLRSTAGGYLLTVGADECDVLRFEALRREGIRAVDAGDLLSGRRLLRQALEQRRGPALQDFVEIFATEAAALEESWADTAERAADVELRLGRPDEALRCLQVSAAAEPLRETTAALRVLAVYRMGRQAEALAVVEETRSALAEALGVDLGTELRALHLRVLRQDPSLQGPDMVRTVRAVPVPLTSFLGREREMVAISDLMRSRRLVTLTGPGGSGKTRLAIEVAAVEASRHERDVAFVDLSSVRDPELIWAAVAAATGRQLAANLDGPRALALQLADRPTLLVLDTMEHLAAAGPGVSWALSHAPTLAVLATSREPLGVEGEQLYAVRPLQLPAQADDAGLVLRAAAVRLFVERAQAADPDFRMTPNDAAVAADLCRRLDGLPLAIELAAPWTRTLGMSALLKRLDRPWNLLDHEARGSDQPARHRSLSTVFEWSYSALTVAQRQLLATLSVFASGAQLETLEAVAGSDPGTVANLASLVERNLVERTGDDREPRYRLLETVRSYAYDHLAERPTDLLAVQERHADHFGDLAEQVARRARTPAGEGLVSRVGREQDEMRATLRHLQEVGATVRALAVVTDCLPLWWDVGDIAEGYRRVLDALADAGMSAPLDMVAAAHAAAASLGESVGAPAAAARHARTAREYAVRAGSRPLEALARCLEGNALAWADWNGQATEGIEILETALLLAQGLPDQGLRWSWTSRTSVASSAALSLVDLLRHRDPARARALLASLRDDDTLGVESDLAAFLHRAAGFLDSDAGRYAEAEDALEHSLGLARSSGSRRSESRSLEELALLAWRTDSLDRARDLADRATRLSRDAGHTINWVRCATLSVDVAMEQGDLEGARLLLAQSQAAAAQGYPDLAPRMLAPREVRLARLAGDTGAASRQLAAMPGIDEGMGLPPARIVHLVELAYAAAASCDLVLVARLTEHLTHAARRIGLALPSPEQRRLDELHSRTPNGSETLL